MSDKRKDNKGRILHNGEVQLADGRYLFKYVNSAGEEKYLYSWRLTMTDEAYRGRRCLSLREMEKKVQVDLFDHIVPNGGDYTVLELVEKYVATKTEVRRTTKTGYGTVMNILKEDPFGKRRIDTVRISDAKCWLIKLQKVDGRGYSSIHSIRGVLRPAFQLAVDDDLIRKNPFGFQLVEVVVNDSVTREALTNDQERRFLKFVKDDPHYSRYYDGIYILFKTGMRVSEFCGLTLSDLDFKLHKTCFKRMIAGRKPPKVEPVIDGYSGFLSFDKDGSVRYSLHWEHYFSAITKKHNKIFKAQMPAVTPHVCRHTYCSAMARAGMNPKTLQYLMGHSDISVTLNTYAHVNFSDAREEIKRINIG